MAKESRIVVALGGNAISQPDEEGNVSQQFANSQRTAHALADIACAGHQLVITHGNGPQIGNFLIRNEAAAGVIYPLPMEVAAAHVQGGMGFMIAQTLTNELARRGDARIVTTIITTVLIDADDPSFRNPTKPIGRVMNQQDADRYRRDEGWSFKEIEPGRFRRVVPSPEPKHILEIETIRRAVDHCDIIIACGGGGIPVVRSATGDLKGVAAVIDKDLAGALLAVELEADTLLILTNVERVRLNYGKPTEQPIAHMTLAEARRHLKDGQFPPGSMGPKVQGLVNFLQNSSSPRAFAAIGPLEGASECLAGRTGTHITRD